MSGEERIDLLVAGAGGGLAGAVRAARAGATVLLVEASEHFLRGNNTSMSTAMIPGAGSALQRDAGVEDSPEQFVADIMGKTHDEADPVLAAAVAEASAPLVDWLSEIGLPMSLVTEFVYPGHSAPRCHTVPGRSGQRLLTDLHAVARRTPGLDLLVPARLVDARRDDSVDGDGWIAVVETPDGAREEIATRHLLLATNGFGASPELVAEHAPEIAGAVYHGSEWSTGDALRLGTALGADTGFLDAYQGHGALAVGANNLAGWALVLHGGIVVNTVGERFADETQGYSEFAALELTQPGGEAVIVYDERVRALCREFEDYLRVEDSGVVRTGSVDEVADRLGLPADALARTLEQAEACRAGAPDEHGRTDWGPAALEPPYSAVRVVPALFHTQGGLKVDGRARVLDTAGEPIPGLYASGGAAMGISGHGAAGYLAGNGLVTALGLAYLAADDVVGAFR